MSTMIEQLRFPVRGYLSAKLTFEDGRQETFEEHTEGETENLIVDLASVLAAAAMKGDHAITHMAVGTDDTAEVVGDTALGNEIARVPVTIAYKSPGDFSFTGGYTNQLEVRGSFDTSVVGLLTEIALFGGPNASAADGGIMVNRKTFPAWDKPSNATVEWVWTLIF